MKISEIIAYVIHWILFSIGFIGFLTAYVVGLDSIPSEVIEAIPEQIDTYWLKYALLIFVTSYLMLLFYSFIGGLIRFLITRKFVLFPWKVSNKEVRTYSEDIQLIYNLLKKIITLFQFNKIKNEIFPIVVILFICLVVIFIGYIFLPFDGLVTILLIAILFTFIGIFNEIKDKLNETEDNENYLNIFSGENHPFFNIIVNFMALSIIFWLFISITHLIF